ncbi:MAG: flap endonuclease [Deltaproteobacteria bacterium]|nr:flap endonuclease [Deltaproteobacteria bacterium]
MRLHLVDGTFELFRAHYGKRPDHHGPDGQDLKATLGVVSSILALFDDPDERATHIAVAFDNPIESFRNEMFDGYKTGEGMEPVLVAQMGPVEEAVRAAGVVVWSMDRWEADDALATGARRWAEQVEQVRIMTPDKDLGQCLQGDRVVQVDRIRRRVIDEAAVRERRGVGPASIPDYLALVGDTADGIPGLPGFGEKGTAALLGEYEHIERIPADTAAWAVKPRGAAKLAATLAERREDALLYRRLATLAYDVPLEETLEDLEWRGAPRQKFLAWCDRVGARNLRQRPSRWRDEG